MKRGIVLSVLFAALLLTGCGKEEHGAKETTLGQLAGISEEETLLIADGQEIPSWRYLYWLRRACAQIAEQYAAVGVDPEWTKPLPEGTALEDYVKQQALSDTLLYAAVEQWAEVYECTLTEEEQADVSVAWESLARQSGGTEACLAALAREGLNRERWEELEQTGKMYAKLYAAYHTPGSILAPVDGEVEQFAQENGYITAQKLTFSAEARDDAKRQAEEAFARINAAGLEERDGLWKELGAVAETFRLGEGVWERTLEETLAVLPEGECSGVLEVQEGFLLLRRLPVDCAQLQDVYFDHLLQAAAEDMEVQVSERYRKISVAEFYEKMQKSEGNKAG